MLQVSLENSLIQMLELALFTSIYFKSIDSPQKAVQYYISFAIDAKETKNLGRISISGKSSFFFTTEAKLGTPLAEAQLLRADLRQGFSLTLQKI